MSCPNERGYVGRDVVIEFAIGCPGADPNALTFKVFGMSRSSEITNTWDTVDATGSTSSGNTRENLVTYKNVSASFDYVSMGTDIENQRELENHIWDPSAATSNQPHVWLRFTYPAKVIQGPFIGNTNGFSSTYDDLVTGSFEAQSNGNVTYTAV